MRSLPTLTGQRHNRSFETDTHRQLRRAHDLPPYGCRSVGSHNLRRFVLEPFSPNARFDFAALTRASAGAVELLDRCWT
jgi:hypothetical protein